MVDRLHGATPKLVIRHEAKQPHVQKRCSAFADDVEKVQRVLSLSVATWFAHGAGKTSTAAWLVDKTRAPSEDSWSTVEQNAELLDGVCIWSDCRNEPEKSVCLIIPMHRTPETVGRYQRWL